ncbi:MAG: serine hydrolase domain-containing protein [Enterococcus sp.]
MKKYKHDAPKKSREKTKEMQDTSKQERKRKKKKVVSESENKEQVVQKKKEKKQKKQKKRKVFIPIILGGALLLAVGVIGGGYYLQEQSEDSSSKKETAQGASTKQVVHSGLTTLEKELAKKLDTELKNENYVGIAYVRSGSQVILNKGYGLADNEKGLLNNPTFFYQIGSVQLSMTATLVLQQIQKGALALDTTLDQFYPQIDGSDKITIEDMLNMTSGLSRTDSATESLYDTELLDYTVNHLKYTESDYGSYTYDTVNYTLLVGILERLTGLTYENMFSQSIVTPLNLTQTGFYKDLKDSSSHAVSYEMSQESDYAKRITETDAEITNELGTGNISMTVNDLDDFYTGVLNGKIVNKDVLATLWKENDDEEPPFTGGVYSGEDAIKFQGTVSNFQTSGWMTRDTDSTIILASNVETDPKIKLPTDSLRDELVTILESE